MELKEIGARKLDGMISRTWLFGEKSTRYLCNLEKRNYVQNVCRNIIHDSDCVTKEAKHISLQEALSALK